MAKYWRCADDTDIVEAVQITDSTFDAPHLNSHFIGVIYDPVHRTALVPTRQGDKIARIADWIVMDAPGQFDVLTDATFALRHKPASSVADIDFPADPSYRGIAPDFPAASV
jgi:hypothetical protein